MEIGTDNGSLLAVEISTDEARAIEACATELGMSFDDYGAMMFKLALSRARKALEDERRHEAIVDEELKRQRDNAALERFGREIVGPSIRKAKRGHRSKGERDHWGNLKKAKS